MTLSPRMAARLSLVVAALLLSTGGAAIKASAFTGWQVASFRSGIAAVAFLLLLPGARRGWAGRVWPAAIAYAGTLVFFVLANKLTTSANAVFFMSAAPLYVALLGPLLLHEPVRRVEWLTMAAVAFGLLITFRAEAQAVATATDPVRGNVLAIVAGICCALMILGLRWNSKQGADRGLAAVAMGNVLACLTALPMALPVGPVTARDVLLILYLGLFQLGAAYLLVTKGLRTVPALEGVLILLIATVLSPVWAGIVHGERPSMGALGGGAIILVATTVLAAQGARAAELGSAPKPRSAASS